MAKIGFGTYRISDLNPEHIQAIRTAVEEGKAKMLAPKYYIAISYPQLTMGEFMTIASVPGAIEKDLAKPFK